MEYKPKNSGILKVEDVKEGDKIVMLEPAYEIFSEAQQKTYWNVKVKLPNGDEKLAGLMDSACDAFAKRWGNNTDDWAGHSVFVNLKTSKTGKQYIALVPIDEPKVEVAVEPTDDVKPEDIPF